MRKILATLLALVMMLGLMVPTAWADEGKDITVYYTNDVHTYIDGDNNYARLATLKKSTENALLVDAGDHVQGSAFGSMDKGETITQLMAAAGYDVATMGNHEFDYGMARALEIIGGEVPYVSCNFYHENNGVAGDPVLEPYKVFEMADGVKVAFVGITTPESFTKSTPAYFQDGNGNYIYGIAGGTDGSALYAAVQTAIDAAALEADYVIALGHLGDDPASDPWNSEDVIANTTGLAAFIDGHSHSSVPTKTVADKDGNNVVLTQTGQYFDKVGKMTISAAGEISTELIDLYVGEEDPANVAEDETVKTIQDAWIASVNEELGVKIGHTDLSFDNYDADGNRLVRSMETNTGDFAADALYYLFDNMDMDVDVAIMNGGGVRNTAVTGDLTYLTCKSIHTFGNVACLQTVTGQQILDALEWGARGVGTGEEIGGFLHVSGVCYSIDTSVPSTVQMDDKGVWCGGPTGEYRVKNVMIFDKDTQSWQPLDLEAKYNLAGYNYTLRDLGDGFAMFDGAVNVLDYVMQDYMVLANYVEGFENGEVAATNSPLNEKYTNLNIDYADLYGDGRIVIGESAAEVETTTVDATCTEDGYVMTTYGEDGKELSYEDLAATGHDFGEWVMTTEPGCETTGVETRTCACGETETREVPAIGHIFRDGVCTVCGLEMDDPEDVDPSPVDDPTDKPTKPDNDKPSDVPTTGDAGITTYVVLATMTAFGVVAMVSKKKEQF